jgi:HSP20 family molecular chaperone IbpA
MNERAFRIDVYENENELLLLADLPGVPADGLDVRVENGELTIEGRRGEKQKYRRVFALDDAGFDLDAVAARQSNGVLELRLPKAAQKRARKIAVNAS